MESYEFLQLKRAFNVMKEDYNTSKVKLDTHLEDKAMKESKLTALEEYQRTLEQTNILLQKTSEHQRKIACKQIQDLGTYALQYVFGAGFRLEIELKGTAKKPEAEIWVVQNDSAIEVKTIPMDDDGGGIVDIVSLALKIVMLQAYEPFIDGPIILDEPGKHVSRGFIVALANLLKEISKTFNRQVILVTHNPYLAEIADKKIMVTLLGGESKVS